MPILFFLSCFESRDVTSFLSSAYDDVKSQGVGHAQVVRKASNREKFNTGHQRWGWTKFVSLEEALPCIMGDSVLIQVEVAVREQDVGEASTFTFRCMESYMQYFPGIAYCEPFDSTSFIVVHSLNQSLVRWLEQHRTG